MPIVLRLKIFVVFNLIHENGKNNKRKVVSQQLWVMGKWAYFFHFVYENYSEGNISETETNETKSYKN